MARVVQLKLLYPNLAINSSTTIETGCSIICVQGGRMDLRGSKISAGTHLVADAGGSLIIRDSFIGRNCVITAKEMVQIDAGCLLAEMVVVRDQNHIPDPTTGELTHFKTAPIHLEAGVWVAAKATVLQGVQIGSRAIVAAHAVVNRSIPAGETWGGIPAKPLRSSTPVS